MKKIFIVDDEPYIIMIIQDKLQKAGYEVISLRTGKGAMDLIRTTKPDLIIMDWMLPDTNGVDICKMIKADSGTCEIPLFMLTAKGQESDEKLGFQCGIDHYITKPFSPKSLLKLIEDTIGKSDL